MINKFTYTAVIPAFNAEKTLHEAVSSILNQTTKPTRIIVVDDGSTDETVKIAQQFGGIVELITQKNAGPGAATTAGFLKCETPFIASLDADDIWLTDKIEQQIAIFDSTPNIDGVFGHVQHYKDGQLLEKTALGWGRTTMLIRREVVLKTGSIIDPPGMRGEMIDWLDRARQNNFKFSMLDRVVALRRIHHNSLSYGRDAAKDIGYLHIARQAILRRRNASNND